MNLISERNPKRGVAGGNMEAVGKPKSRFSPAPTIPLEISPKPRDSHFPTAPTTASVFSNGKAKAKPKTKVAA